MLQITGILGLPKKVHELVGENMAHKIEHTIIEGPELDELMDAFYQSLRHDLERDAIRGLFGLMVLNDGAIGHSRARPEVFLSGIESVRGLDPLLKLRGSFNDSLIGRGNFEALYDPVQGRGNFRVVWLAEEELSLVG